MKLSVGATREWRGLWCTGSHQTTLNRVALDFPGSLVVKTLCFQCKGMGLIPGMALRAHVLSGVARKEKKRKVASLYWNPFLPCREAGWRGQM